MTPEEYIDSFPEEIRLRLKQIRTAILDNAPGAEEGFAYRMPAYRLNGRPLVYFAAFRNHIGLYATPTGHAEFAKELSFYRHGRGSVQFPSDMPLPIDLITRIIKFRVKENMGDER